MSSTLNKRRWAHRAARGSRQTTYVGRRQVGTEPTISWCDVATNRPIRGVAFLLRGLVGILDLAPLFHLHLRLVSRLRAELRPLALRGWNSLLDSHTRPHDPTGVSHMTTRMGRETSPGAVDISSRRLDCGPSNKERTRKWVPQRSCRRAKGSHERSKRCVGSHDAVCFFVFCFVSVLQFTYAPSIGANLNAT